MPHPVVVVVTVAAADESSATLGTGERMASSDRAHACA